MDAAGREAVAEADGVHSIEFSFEVLRGADVESTSVIYWEVNTHFKISELCKTVNSSLCVWVDL